MTSNGSPYINGGGAEARAVPTQRPGRQHRTGVLKTQLFVVSLLRIAFGVVLEVVASAVRRLLEKPAWKPARVSV